MSGSHASLLRHELRLRNVAFAQTCNLAHATSYGECPVLLYGVMAEERRHGNFMDASYRAILDRPAWRRRLGKVHTSAARSLPPSDRGWKELDSSMSSDALLMNVFCHPATINRSVCAMLGVDYPVVPEFGFRARVPLKSAGMDRTEVDMKIGQLLVEAKLTEADFQIQKAGIVESYRDLERIFDLEQLPRTTAGEYISYQLMRNVLAAAALELNFCVFVDERRPDLKDKWYRIMQCIVDTDLKTRCKVLTWQELAEPLPSKVQVFLDLKYGIVPRGRTASRPWEETEG